MNKDDSMQMKLKSEKIDIDKEWIKTNDVKIRKEVTLEDKSITVPIKKEYLIIEKNSLDGKLDNNTIRIPISEEQIQIEKKWVVLEDIRVFTNKYQELETFEEILKHEKLHVDKFSEQK